MRCLDCSSGRSDDVLDDREPEAGPARGACAICAVEALEQAGKRVVGNADARVGGLDHNVAALTASGQGAAGTGTGVANGILEQVLRDDAEHAGAQRHLGLGVALDGDEDAGPRGGLGQRRGDLAQHREHARRSEGDDGAAGLELAQEENLVDELADLVDFGPRLLNQLRDVRARQERGLEQREETR